MGRRINIMPPHRLLVARAHSQKNMEKKEIKGISLIGIRSRTSNSYGKNLPYMRYRVFVTADEGVKKLVPIEEVFTKEELKEGLSYWSTRSESMSMTCWGTSQLFEAKISLGRFLGWNEKDWPKFSRKCEELIKEI